MLDALDREIFVRSVRTNPRYSEVLDTDAGGFSAADQRRVMELMRPGMLIVQTPEKAREHGVVTLQTLQQQQALQAAQRAGGGGGFGSSVAARSFLSSSRSSVPDLSSSNRSQNPSNSASLSVGEAIAK